MITTQPSSTATAGVAFATQPVVSEEDQFGNVVTSDSTPTVTAARGTQGTAALQGSPLTVTFTNGVASFSGLSYNKAETMNLIFSTNASGLTSVMSNSVLVSPAAASQLVITTQPSSTATAGVAFATQPVVAEEDAFGNIITTDSTHTVTAARGSQGTAPLQGSPLAVTLTNGVATFSGLSYNKAETMNIAFTTNASGVTSATSNHVVVSSAAASQLAVTTQPSATATAGVTFVQQPVVAEEDQFGNLITSDSTSTVTVARGSQGTASLQGSPLTVTLSGGVATFTGLSYNKAETMNLAFTTNATGVTSATSNNIVVSPAAASQLVVTTQPSATAMAGVAFAQQPVVSEEDQFGNVITSDSTDTVTAARGSQGTGTLQGSNLTVTLANGVATFSGLSYNKAETMNIAFTTNASGVTSATSNSVVVSQNGANQLAFLVQPSNTGGTLAINPAVQVAVEDSFGNVLTGDNTDQVTLSLGTNPSGGTLSGTLTQTVVNGIATFNNLSVNKAGTGYTLQASINPSTTATSNAFNITLVVTSLVANPTGFTATFSDAFNPADINLTGPSAIDGAPSVTLVGSGGSGTISGSLYLDPTDTKLTFVQTVLVGSNGLPINAGTLPLGTYTVTLVSASGSPVSGFATTGGQLLDGNSDGTAGDNYTTTFHVVSGTPAPGDVLLTPPTVLATVPDFARGPNTPNLTIASSNGATESGNTVTITTTSGHGYTVGQTVVIAGVTVAGYNGTFTIASIPSSTTFTYTDPTAGLAASGNGTANVANVNVPNNSADGIPIDLTVLAPVQTLTFSGLITTGTTGTFKLGFNSQTTPAITVGTTIKVQTTSASTSGASESGTTVTIRTSAVHGLKVGESVTISGVGVAGYNGTFTVTGVPTTTSFTYTAASGLGLSGGGTWNLNGGASLATAIQGGLASLSAVGGSANVAVTGTGPFTVTFSSAVANPNLITLASNAISSAPTLTIVNANAPASVTDVVLVLSYNANLLTITGGTVNAALPGATFTVSTSGSGTAALATITFHSGTGVNLGTLGSVDLGGLIATVPNTAAYKSKALLHLVSESVNGGALTAVGVDGYQVVAYQGDTDGNGFFTSNDATLLSQVASGTNPGFAAYRQIDPVLIGGVSGGTSVSATDSGLMASYLNGVAVSQLPDQTGVTPSSFAPGPDPSISIPTGLKVGADGTVTVPVNIDDPRPAGSTGLTQVELALSYDPKVFTLTAADVHLGTVPASGSGWSLSTVVDPATGVIAITLVSQTPIATSTGGSLVTIDFHQVGTIGTGATPIQLVASVNLPGQGMFSTAAFDSNDRFILSPAPTNAAMNLGIGGQVVLSIVNTVPGVEEPNLAREKTATTSEDGSRQSLPGGPLGAGMPVAVALKDEVHQESGPNVPLAGTVAVAGNGVADHVTVAPSAGAWVSGVAGVPVTGQVFQFGSIVIQMPVSGNSPQQQAADQWFTGLARDGVAPAMRIDATDDAFSPALASQLLSPRTTQDHLDRLLWNNPDGELAWWTEAAESLPTTSSGRREGQAFWATQEALADSSGWRARRGRLGGGPRPRLARRAVTILRVKCFFSKRSLRVPGTASWSGSTHWRGPEFFEQRRSVPTWRLCRVP